jgi:histidinol phosphatase-like PHP family hydrolase
MSDLFRGRVLFHCHTDLTDGQPSVEDYVRYAAEHGLDRVVFLEHIRRSPSYDVAAFADAVWAAGERFDVPVAVGFEAKVLPGGALDIDDDHLALADVIGIAEHGFPDDADLWEQSLRQAFAEHGDHVDRVAVWVHPGLWLKKTRRLESYRAVYLDLLDAAQAAGVLVEQNARYGLIPDDLIARIRPNRFVRGIDAHRLADVGRFFAG